MFFSSSCNSFGLFPTSWPFTSLIMSPTCRRPCRSIIPPWRIRAITRSLFSTLKVTPWKRYMTPSLPLFEFQFHFTIISSTNPQLQDIPPTPMNTDSYSYYSVRALNTEKHQVTQKWFHTRFSYDWKLLLFLIACSPAISYQDRTDVVLVSYGSSHSAQWLPNHHLVTSWREWDGVQESIFLFQPLNTELITH